MSAKRAGTSGRDVIVRILLCLVLSFCVLLMLVFSSMHAWPVQLLYHAVAGPFIHAWANLPAFLAKWPQAILPFGCLALACAGCHRFIQWCLKASGGRTSWRPANTLTVISLLLCGSAAAITLSGAVHQLAWLGSTPWVEYNHKSDYFEAAIKTREILRSLRGYESENNRFPDSLSFAVERTEERGVEGNLLWMEPAAGAPMEPFVLLRPGGTDIGVSLPLVISPMIRRGRSVLVGYTDGEVRDLDVEEWRKELLRLQEYD
jgi:hypothetical protein